MTVCITVATMIGVFCANNATPPPVAECWGVPDGLYCHVSDPATLPAVVSFYVPSEGHINCDDDCSVLGDMTPVDECIDCAACPLGMYGRWVNIGGNVYQCRDHGGAIRPNFGERYTAAGFWTGWHVIFDILAADGNEPQNAYELVEWYTVEGQR